MSGGVTGAGGPATGLERPRPAAALEARVRIAARGVDVAVRAESGQVLAVVGPNGAGKSTLLGALAGLLAPDEGRVTLGGRVLTDTTSGADLPPWDRRTVLLGQDPLLFPHLDVLANVAFGPRSAGVRRAEAERRARHWLTEVDAGDLAGRRPAELSGGQAQRVAVARALAAEPDVLLLDEPLAALDVDSGPLVRRLLARVLDGRTAVLVTHDLLDVLALADQVVVVEGGRVVEAGEARDVLHRPRSRFAARLADLDLVHGVATEDGLLGDSDDGDGVRLVGLVDPDCVPGAPAVAVFAPAAVAVHVEPPSGSPRNVLPGRVTQVEPRGAVVRLQVGVGTTVLHADVTAAAATDLGLVPGTAVHLAVKATEVAVHASRR